MRGILVKTKTNSRDVFSSTNVLQHLYYVAYPLEHPIYNIMIFSNTFTNNLVVTEDNVDAWIMIKDKERMRLLDVARDTDIKYPGEVFVVWYTSDSKIPHFERYYTYEEFIRANLYGDVTMVYNSFTDNLALYRDGRAYLPFKVTAEGKSLYSELMSTRHFEDEEENKNYIYRRMFTLRGALKTIGLKGIDLTYTKNRAHNNGKSKIIKRLYGYKASDKYRY